MKTLKHTSGPWRYGRTLTHGLSVFNKVDVGSPEHVVAVLEDNVNNASLIAAAPELLIWCKELLTQLKIEAPNKYNGVIEHVNKVIAKAEGEES